MQPDSHTQPPEQPIEPDKQQATGPEPNEAAAKPRRIWAIVGLLVFVCLVAGVAWALGRHSIQPKASSAVSSQGKTTIKAASAQGLQLDTSKNYGNKYADGILPVGDGKYSTAEARKGYVYACSTYAQNLNSNQGGAGSRGPWFTDNNTEYDINKKVHVSGSVTWQPSLSVTENGSNRLITTNDLPNHPTGIFPIASSDAAYAYDRNPNSIESQSLSYSLPLSPTYGTPQCMGGEAGIMLTGVALFNAFDAGGRDAGAWEVQDDCGGHPQVSGEYHYHTLSSCISDTNVSTVIGYALDGFPITGPKVGTNNILTTDDLDECHGIVSQITLDNKKVTMYHYVMTQDFPYSVSCFRAQPVQVTPSDRPEGQQAGPPPVR